MQSKTNYKKIIAQNLLYLLQTSNISRKELCDATNIKYTTLCGWVNGRTYPRLDTLEVVAGYFSIELPDMFVDLEHASDSNSRLAEYERRIKMTVNQNYMNTYPEGFFEFFSQSHDIDFEEPDDPLPEETDFN